MTDVTSTMRRVKSLMSMACLLMAPALFSASMVVAEDAVDLRGTLGEESIAFEITYPIVITYTPPNTTDDADAIDVRTLANELAYWST